MENISYVYVKDGNKIIVEFYTKPTARYIVSKRVKEVNHDGYKVRVLFEDGSVEVRPPELLQFI